MNVPDAGKLILADDEQPIPISELAKRTQTSHRTIHFYIQEGLIPPPSGAGGGALYGAEHRVKLLLIRKLQQEGQMKLKGIRQVLEMIRFVPPESLGGMGIPISDETAEEVLDQLAKRIKTQQIVDRDEGKHAQERMQKRVAEYDEDKLNYSLLQNVQTVRRAARHEKAGRETWQKIAVADGLELLVRSDVEGRHGADIDDAVRRLQKIMRGRNET